MALMADERQAAYAAARRYIDQHDVGIQISEPMLNGLLDAVIAALEPLWAEKPTAPKTKPAVKLHASDDE